MSDERTYSTRELAQMWNLSESTIKRWADAGQLHCQRTPGGHRRFQVQDIRDFQTKHRFEGTGLLTFAPWEDPDIEVSVNQKKLDKVRDSILYLATQNQSVRIKDLLERLYIRGMTLFELYDDVLVPLAETAQEAVQTGKLVKGQERLVGINLEEAMYNFFPRVIRRRPNGKTGLCGAPENMCAQSVNAIARTLEVEGWECLKLGENVPLDTMAQMVEQEPVNLVCVASSKQQELSLLDHFDTLYEASHNYRIPLVMVGKGFADSDYRSQFPHDDYFSSLKSLRDYIVELNR